jgi:hypothetical protein
LNAKNIFENSMDKQILKNYKIIPESMELNPWGSIRKMSILRVKNME